MPDWDEPRGLNKVSDVESPLESSSDGSPISRMDLSIGRAKRKRTAVPGVCELVTESAVTPRALCVS